MDGQGMAHRQPKGDNYIRHLDEARTNSRWDQVPEYARKVIKHAPNFEGMYGNLMMITN